MEKMDRRVRKTRALLLQGLVKMLETHDIQDISVKELTELVDINRGTFYLHYDDIYDMLHKIEDEMFLEFNEIMEQKPVVTNSGLSGAVVGILPFSGPKQGSGQGHDRPSWGSGFRQSSERSD